MGESMNCLFDFLSSLSSRIDVLYFWNGEKMRRDGSNKRIDQVMSNLGELFVITTTGELFMASKSE